MALEPSSAIRAPKPIPYADSPLSRLPVEIKLLIFRLCDPDIKARLGLTHICRQWRSTAINSPSLWTFIRIAIDSAPHSKRSDNLIALLNTQLGRADSLPLDVEWTSSTTFGYDPRLLDVIRQKGPFSRWRTLKFGFLDEVSALDSRDVFSNLESIVILPFASDRILETIDRTTTSKLQFLEVQDSVTTQIEMETKYKGMMRRIRHLKIYSADVKSIPSNILDLDAGFRVTHHFPHVETYKLTICLFVHNPLCDLHSVTNLTVTTAIMVGNNATIYLPALRHLSCRAIVIGVRTKFEAPILETLHLLHISRKATNGKIMKQMIRTLNHDGYRLSPTKSVTLDTRLPSDIIITVLERSPCVEQVSLSFGDRVSAQKMLERMQGPTDVEERGAAGNCLCEKMVELRINLGYPICDVRSWKDWASRFVETRSRSGSVPRVYASWKGEGTCVALA